MRGANFTRSATACARLQDDMMAGGIGTHIFPRHQAPDPDRKLIDQIYGEDAKIIGGCVVERGSGCLPLEAQLANHVAHIRQTAGDLAARRLILKLLAHDGVNVETFRLECVRRNLLRSTEA